MIEHRTGRPYRYKFENLFDSIVRNINSNECAWTVARFDGSSLNHFFFFFDKVAAIND